MKCFSQPLHVRIVKALFPGREELVGMTGRVARLRMGQTSAWIETDQPLPEKFRSFREDDSKANWVLVEPEECEVTKPPKPATEETKCA